MIWELLQWELINDWIKFNTFLNFTAIALLLAMMFQLFATTRRIKRIDLNIQAAERERSNRELLEEITRKQAVLDLKITADALEKKQAALAFTIAQENELRDAASQLRHKNIDLKLQHIEESQNKAVGLDAADRKQLDTIERTTDETNTIVKEVDGTLTTATKVDLIEHTSRLEKKIQEGSDHAAAAFHEANSVNKKIEDLNKRLLDKENKE